MSLPPIAPVTAGRWPRSSHETLSKPLHVDVDAPPRSMSPGLQINYGNSGPNSDEVSGSSSRQLNKSYGPLGTREVHFNVEEDTRKLLPTYEQVSNLPTPTEPWVRATFPSVEGGLPIESELLVRLVPFGSHRVVSEYRPVLAERLAEQNGRSTATLGRRIALNPVQPEDKLPQDHDMGTDHPEVGSENPEVDSAVDETETVPEDGLPAHYKGSQTDHSYTYVQLLGSGAFLKVVLARDRTDESAPSSPHIVAIKVFRISRDHQDAYTLFIDREIGILRTLDHPGVLKMLDYNVSSEQLQYLVLRYLPGGSLLEFLRQFYQNNRVQTWYWCFVKLLIRDLLRAVQYLHENSVVHRDIKLENILLNVDPASAVRFCNDDGHFDEAAFWGAQSGDTKSIAPGASRRSYVTLIDFGLLKKLESPQEELLTRCGSLEYTLPELLMGLKYLGQATDAWLCGVVIYLLLENRLPFDPPPALPMPEGRMVLPLVMKRQRQKNRTPHRIAMIDWAWFESALADDMTVVAQKLVLTLHSLVEKLLVRRQSRCSVNQALDMLEEGV